MNMNISLTPFAPDNLISRTQPSYSTYKLRLNLVLTHGIPPDSRGGVNLKLPLEYSYLVQLVVLVARNIYQVLYEVVNCTRFRNDL